MSSAAIMAIIKQKEAELQELQNTKKQLSKVNDAVDCMSNNFKKASSLMSEVGTIGGMPIDNGATAIAADNFLKLSTESQGLLADVTGTVSGLEAEISSLYAQYQAALLKEAEEAAKAAKETAETKDNS